MTSNVWEAIMQKISIIVLGILGLMGTQAGAADMAVKAPLPAPPPVQDWSGVYVGLEGAMDGANKIQMLLALAAIHLRLRSVLLSR
jgi:hypothetical protein